MENTARGGWSSLGLYEIGAPAFDVRRGHRTSGSFVDLWFMDRGSGGRITDGRMRGDE